MGICESLQQIHQRYPLYKVKNSEYPEESIPFRVSPEPLFITEEQQKELEVIGVAITSYFGAVQYLYQTNKQVNNILNLGKSKHFAKKFPKYLFLRPDLVMTSEGFKICEIETSVFGLGLSDILNQVYSDEFQTLVSPEKLKMYFKEELSKTGKILYTSKGERFEGQIQYLADVIFPEGWEVEKINPDNFKTVDCEVYRAFYATEFSGENEITTKSCIPSLTPQFEEKAVMSLIWDSRFKKEFVDYLGSGAFAILRRIIPQTVILGQEKYCDFDIPTNISELSKGSRKWVWKESLDSSWCQGIEFLHKISHDRVKELIDQALKSNQNYILQKFYEGEKVKMEYFDKSKTKFMEGKVRITPYYGLSGLQRGKMLSIKATLCEGTERVHGTKDCINTAVAVR